MKLKPSKYQQNILDSIKELSGSTNKSLVCNALAGSGKTSTLLLICQQLVDLGYTESEIQLCVFGKENSLDIVRKFGKKWEGSISTLHSLGYKVLSRQYDWRKPKIDNFKYSNIGKELEYLNSTSKFKNKIYRKPGSLLADGVVDSEPSFLKLLDFVRLTLSDCSIKSLKAICGHFGIEGIHVFEEVYIAIKEILQVGQELARKNAVIDFTDMIYLPSKFPSFPMSKPSWILVDECQDLNAAQLNLVQKLGGKTSNFLFVGDRHQAIYGFAGADCNSVETITTKTKAKELPLSICYRCPKSHLDLVNTIFPELKIESRDKCPEGTLELLSENSSLKNLINGDLVLSRKTAPLVKLCIQLLATGKKAVVKGRDIAKQIEKVIREIADLPGFEYRKFLYFSAKYLEFQSEKYANTEFDNILAAIEDKVEAITAIYIEKSSLLNIEEMINYLTSLFSDNEAPITLCTVHRAKGLESDRVFILDPNSMPLFRKDMAEWQMQQEDNLLYVALTRSKDYLGIICEKAPNWYVEAEKPLATSAK
jgi:superfamily I DNA/RNA helicase